MYTKIYSKMWFKNRFRALSEGAQLLYIYLFSCEHRSIIGLFRLPINYICDDLNLDKETVTKRLDELFRNGFIIYDETISQVLITGFLKHNPLQNPNQVNAAMSALDEIEPSPLYIALADILNLLNVERYKPLEERLRNSYETVSAKNTYTDTNTDTDTDTKGEQLPPPPPPDDSPGTPAEMNLRDPEVRKVTLAFETNIHGPISPFEAQDLTDWLDKLPADAILYAIREAVLHNKKSMSYINSILRTVDGAGVNDIESWNRYLEKRQEARGGTKQDSPHKDIKLRKYTDQEIAASCDYVKANIRGKVTEEAIISLGYESGLANAVYVRLNGGNTQ